MKVNVNIPESVLEPTDKRAAMLGLSRSSYITMTLSEKNMQNDLIENLPNMLETMKKLAEKEGVNKT